MTGNVRDVSRVRKNSIKHDTLIPSLASSGAFSIWHKLISFLARCDVLIHYLRNTEMTTNDIAFLLGYLEINSFLRAFTVWTRKTVSDYRKDLAK